jgi:hypothetical protein
MILGICDIFRLPHPPEIVSRMFSRRLISLSKSVPRNVLIQKHLNPIHNVYSLRRVSLSPIARVFSTNNNSSPQPPKPTQQESAAKDATSPPPNQETTSQDSSLRKMDFDEYDDYEPKTAREKVSYYSVVGLRLGFLLLGAVCIYFTAKELFPGRLSPQSLFSEVFEYLRYKEEVLDLTYCCYCLSYLFFLSFVHHSTDY